ncbi:MAG TPA: quinone-dependent dihydroorotate dehydrogenase [Chitinophagales bacterium]|nr:quinone-dependent dihydroorotate dehydrogenase [Chitinophagales bacterium]
MNVYPLLKPLLFKLDPEEAHHFTIHNLKLAGKLPFLLNLVSGKVEHPKLHRHLFGLDFPNPVGLAAGLDKNGDVIDEMGRMGFGFIEIGTVTPRPQPGNDKPRLFRLVKDSALINRMGFNNVGVEVAAEHLKRRKTDIIVGANIGKNKVTANEDAINDYVICFKALFEHAHYFVVNVSSPNTPGLRALQDKDSLLGILNALQDINNTKAQTKPILLKIAPDLTNEQIDDVVSVVRQTKIQGIVATNTTISREGLSYSQQEIEAIGMGGLSGKPLTQRSTEVIKRIHQQIAGTDIKLIGVGGIMTAEDGIEKLNAGSDLIQLYSGFIYKGPQLIADINNRLLQQA